MKKTAIITHEWSDTWGVCPVVTKANFQDVSPEIMNEPSAMTWLKALGDSEMLRNDDEVNEWLGKNQITTVVQRYGGLNGEWIVRPCSG